MASIAQPTNDANHVNEAVALDPMNHSSAYCRLSLSDTLQQKQKRLFHAGAGLWVSSLDEGKVPFTFQLGGWQLATTIGESHKLCHCFGFAAAGCGTRIMVRHV